jgi:hypothetical protein
MNPNGKQGSVSPPVVPIVGELFLKKWRLTAMLVAVIAIGAQFLSMRCAADAADLMARAIAQSDVQIADGTFWIVFFSDQFHIVSLILGLAASACWGVSLWNGEPGRQSVIVVFLAAWALLCFVMV